jgi:N-formylglutamate deformylase
MLRDVINRPFSLQLARPGGVPLVFDSPHSGFEFPADFRPSASRAEIRTTWDAYVDELCGGVVGVGGALLAARFPRAYIDVNRAANDIDPEMLATPWQSTVELSEHGRRGLGLIRRYTEPGIALYSRRLTVAEIRTRLNEFYHPYRRALQQTLNSARKRHGVVWHFNWHSMKSRPPAGRPLTILRPDFVISDRNGTTAPPALTAWVARFFSRRGYRVQINDPFRGADIVRQHGVPAERRYSIQIEINRSLYMDEQTCERNAGFAGIRTAVTAFAQTVADAAIKQVVAT